MAAPLTVLDLPGHDPRANLTCEEQLFNALRTNPQPTLLFYINSPCVVLGRSNDLPAWANADALKADGVPVLRRFSGGGAVYHDLDNLNFSFLLPKSLVAGLLPGSVTTLSPAMYIDFFRGVVIRALGRGGSGLAQAGVSDITLNGRKISGNAQRIAASLVLHHGTLMRHCPLAAIERYLPVPPNRPGIAHRGFITGLTEEGYDWSVEELKQWLTDELEHTIGL